MWNETLESNNRTKIPFFTAELSQVAKCFESLECQLLGVPSDWRQKEKDSALSLDYAANLPCNGYTLWGYTLGNLNSMFVVRTQEFLKACRFPHIKSFISI